MWFIDILRDYIYVNPIATIIGHDMGFVLNLPGRICVRAPDLGIILHTNPVPLGDREGSYRGVYDICIESVSDSKRHHITRDTEDKFIEYAQAGVPEYFILDESPPRRANKTAFYQLSSSGVYQPIQPIGGVIQSAILPGFQFRVEHLYSQPHPVKLLDDPVYRAFISPHVRAEKQRHADKLEQALIEERARTKKLRAYLSSLGLNFPDDLR